MFDPRMVRAVYDRRAASFDRFVRLASLGRDGAMRRKFVAQLRLRPGQLVAAVGYGTGRDEPALRSAGVRVVALDISRAMLWRGRADLRVQADAAFLPLRSCSSDAVLATFLLGTVDVPRALEEMERIVRPGGWVVVSEDRLPAGWYLGPRIWLRRLLSRGWDGVERVVLRWMVRRLRGVRRGSMFFGLIFWVAGRRDT